MVAFLILFIMLTVLAIRRRSASASTAVTIRRIRAAPSIQSACDRTPGRAGAPRQRTPSR